MLECSNVSLGYEGNTVVSQLNFNISKGDYLCIVGENGSGKSTVVKGILGLLSPISGKISSEIEKHKIGYLPQLGGIPADFPASVEEVVLSGFCGKLGRKLFYGLLKRAEAGKKMELMRIGDLKNKSISELSGGQRQRVLLARALCAGSELLVLDEPAASLDAVSADELYSAVKGINASQTTIVMVTHDINAAVSNATHILHLGNKDVFFGTVGDYKNCRLQNKSGGGNE